MHLLTEGAEGSRSPISETEEAVPTVRESAAVTRVERTGTCRHATTLQTYAPRRSHAPHERPKAPRLLSVGTQDELQSSEEGGEGE